jgi:hypothetical protein
MSAGFGLSTTCGDKSHSVEGELDSIVDSSLSNELSVGEWAW